MILHIAKASRDDIGTASEDIPDEELLSSVVEIESAALSQMSKGMMITYSVYLQVIIYLATVP